MYAKEEEIPSMTLEIYLYICIYERARKKNIDDRREGKKGEGGQGRRAIYLCGFRVRLGPPFSRNWLLHDFLSEKCNKQKGG
jgi:hypothetical protein